MKYLILLASFVIVTIAAYPQSSPGTIKAQGMAMAKALVTKDYTTFAKFMHPKVVEYAGGSAKLLQQMDTMNVMAARFGAEIKKITIGNPGKIVSYKKELQTTIPQLTEMSSAMGSVTLESTLVAISEDQGKTWKFIDTMVTNVRELKKVMPDLSPDLVIPAMKPPKFVPNNANAQ